jgi:ABC-2 type transport system ATP-binding protein
VDIPHPRSRYREPTRALTDVDLTAPQGRITAVVGTNGAGKSTIVHALTGALRPNRGSIEVLGIDIGPPDRPCPVGVGVVPDHPLFPDEWTAEDVIRLRARMGDAFDPDVFVGILRERGIRRRTMIRSLSAGQATIFSLAHALAADPMLLILDEPFARLDPLARSELIDLFRERLADEDSRSILLTSHDLDGMDRYVDQLAVLHRGRTVLEGAVDTLLDDHLVAADGAGESLLPAEDAVGLPAGTSMREIGLTDLVRLTLAAARSEGER